ncbi:hypothetical protein ADUPG1_008134 [Aduncisulcus paluster]|uniref:RRM domain-containing protein n=1 Tax=Aduncisulcus paluster TaxID=2918883 RepID=A0ABQ5KQV4_9EUKA|nr:hypothetical protein ADUPG1_008134 [Aduncisulcus paluster]
MDTIYISNLFPGCTQKDIEELLPSSVTLKASRFNTTPSGITFAFITLDGTSHDIKETVSKLDGFLFRERHLRVEFPKDPKHERTIYISSIPDGIRSPDLMKAFEAFAPERAYVRCLNRGTENQREIGFVVLSDKATRDRVLEEMKDLKLGDVSVTIASAHRPRYRPRSSHHLEE